MQVLVVNCGSSSLKLTLVDPASGARSGSARVERIGGPGGPADLAAALDTVLPGLVAEGDVAAVGHRVVHGGARFRRPTLVDDDVLAAIETLTPLAPLHNPANLAGIRAARAALPGVPHVAVFDTAFHATLPEHAWRYALPTELADRHGVRRYGFHGTSHAWVAGRAAAALDADLNDLRIISCHLGNGCSVAAIEAGHSVETSMGMTPLEGLVMGTRSGDVDPGALLALARAEGLGLDALDDLLNRRSGLAGLSGVGNDMRDIEAGAEAGDPGCRDALDVFVHRLRKYIGAYAAVLGGVDALVFTGGIGQNSATVRRLAVTRLDFLGARIDEHANRDAAVGVDHPVEDVSAPNARCRVLVIAADEGTQIARETAEVALGMPGTIPLAVSARHVHLTVEAVGQLFGPGHQLTPYRALSQPGQFACEERVDVVGPRGTLEGVRIIGPPRRACQVEVSRTDEFALGLDAPIRRSGDVGGSAPVTLVGPEGTLDLTEGVIQARRHIHMTPGDAAKFGVKDGDIVRVGIDSEGRDLTFGDVTVRVSPKFRLEMHIDTDEANAADISSGDTGLLVRTGATVRLLAG